MRSSGIWLSGYMERLYNGLIICSTVSGDDPRRTNSTMSSRGTAALLWEDELQVAREKRLTELRKSDGRVACKIDQQVGKHAELQNAKHGEGNY